MELEPKLAQELEEEGEEAENDDQLRLSRFLRFSSRSEEP